MCVCVCVFQSLQHVIRERGGGYRWWFVCVCVCVYKYGTRGAHLAGRCLFLCVRVRVCLCAFRSFVVVIEGSDDDDDVLSFRATS